jgi:hypothetical protein
VSTRQSNKYEIDVHLVGCFIEYLKMHGTTNPKNVTITFFTSGYLFARQHEKTRLSLDKIL